MAVLVSGWRFDVIVLVASLLCNIALATGGSTSGLELPPRTRQLSPKLAELVEGSASIRKLEEAHGNSSEEGTVAAEGGEEGGQPGEQAGEEGEEGEEKEEEEAEEGEEEEEEIDDISLAVAVTLLGVVFFVMGAVYLVHWPSHDVRDQSWEVISLSMSIFICVCYYQALDSLLDQALAPEEANMKEGHPKNIGRLFTGLIHFIIIRSLSFITLVVFGKFKSDLWFTAAATCGAHLCGFAAKEVFSQLMHLPPFCKSPGLAFLCVLICSVILLLSMLPRALGDEERCLMKIFGFTEERAEKLREQSLDGENDVVSMSISYQLSLFFRFCILGRLPPTEFKPVGHTSGEAGILLGIGLAVGLLTVPIQLLRNVKKIDSPGFERAIDLGTKISAMTMAWCLLYWGHWEIVHVHIDNKLVGSMVVALIFSVLGGLFVLLFDVFVKKCFAVGSTAGLKEVMSGVGLLIGFSWELCFDIAVEDVSEGENALSTFDIKLLLGIFVVIVVAPGWVLYILPKTMEETHKETGPKAAWAETSEEPSVLGQKETGTKANEAETSKSGLAPECGAQVMSFKGDAT